MGWAAGSETPRVGLNGRSRRPKTRKAAGERPHTIRVTKPTLLCQLVGHSEGFRPRKNPPKSGRVGEGSHRAALKTRNPPRVQAGALLHFDNYGHSITRRSKCQWLTLRPTKPFAHCGEKPWLPAEDCGASARASKIAPGVPAPGLAPTERAPSRPGPLGPHRFKREPKALSLIRSETSLIR